MPVSALPNLDTALPNLDHVYAKWENRGPKGPSYHGNTGLKNGGAVDTGLQNGKDTPGGEVGKQKWKERFGGKVQPLKYRRARDKTKVLALSTESVSSLENI